MRRSLILLLLLVSAASPLAAQSYAPTCITPAQAEVYTAAGTGISLWAQTVSIKVDQPSLVDYLLTTADEQCMLNALPARVQAVEGQIPTLLSNYQALGDAIAQLQTISKDPVQGNQALSNTISAVKSSTDAANALGMANSNALNDPVTGVFTQLAKLQTRVTTLEAAPAPGPTPTPVPSNPLRVKLAACVASRLSPVYVTTDDGGLAIFSMPAAGVRFTCSLTVPQAGSYTLYVRAASAVTAQKAHFEFPAGTNVGSVSPPNTGAWDLFATVKGLPVTLPAGPVSIVFVADTRQMNLNWIQAQ